MVAATAVSTVAAEPARRGAFLAIAGVLAPGWRIRDHPPQPFRTRSVKRDHMDKIWLKNYPPGVPPEIRWDDYPSVGALVDACVRKYASRITYANHMVGKGQAAC